MARGPQTADGDGRRLCLDLTTLWLHRRSRPTGIRRVELELARVLRQTDPGARFVVFDRRVDAPRHVPLRVVDALVAQDGHVDVPAVAARPGAGMLAGARAAAASVSRAGARFRTPLLALATALHAERHLHAVAQIMESGQDPPRDWRPLAPHEVGLFLFAGIGWERPVFPFLARLKALDPGMRVAAVVYDLIPMVRPELCNSGVVRVFPGTMQALAAVADVVLCISEATRADFLRLAAAPGRDTPPSAVVQLGDDTHRTQQALPPPFALEQGGPFVLMVGTIEPRKNHEFAYRLWRRLAETHANLAVPLVWVGARGWNTADLLARVAADPTSPDLIHVLDDIPDAALAWMYDHALFTIFPSHYEGWGLPIRESLAHGKVCVAGVGSSLEEAGAGLAIHLDTFDQEAWLAEVVRLLGQPAYREEVESRIRSQYRQLPWREACEGIVAAAQAAHPGS